MREKKLFNNFLSFYKIKESFYRNLEKERFMLLSKKPLEQPSIESINYAFCWSETPEGHKFWSRIDCFWRVYSIIFGITDFHNVNRYEDLCVRRLVTSNSHNFFDEIVDFFHKRINDYNKTVQDKILKLVELKKEKEKKTN